MTPQDPSEPPEPDQTTPSGEPGPSWPSYDPSGGSEPGQPGYPHPSYGQGAYPPPPPQQPGYGAPGYGGPGYGGPGYGGPGYGYVQKNGTATTSMVLGIVAVVSILLTPFCCITLPGIFTGPFAIWTGLKARREIDLHPGYYGNRSQAVAGLVTGIVATVLGVLMILAVLVFLGFADWNGSYDNSMF